MVTDNYYMQPETATSCQRLYLGKLLQCWGNVVSVLQIWLCKWFCRAKANSSNCSLLKSAVTAVCLCRVELFVRSRNHHHDGLPFSTSSDMHLSGPKSQGKRMKTNQWLICGIFPGNVSEWIMLEICDPTAAKWREKTPQCDIPLKTTSVCNKPVTLWKQGDKRRCPYSCKHGIFILCWLNVRPASTTLA